MVGRLGGRLGCALALLGVGCTSIPLDYTPDGGSVDAGSGDSASATDAAPAMDAEPVDAGSGPPCPCDASAGLGCCILGGGVAPFCTANGEACTGANGVFSACQVGDPDTESECCWSGSPAAGGSTHYASSCGQRPASCSGPADCPRGEPCELATCSGMTVGACGVMPTCP
jgi:hypothetical protein